MVGVKFLQRPYEQGLAMLPKLGRLAAYSIHLDPTVDSVDLLLEPATSSGSRDPSPSQEPGLDRALKDSAALQQSLDVQRTASAERLQTALARYSCISQKVIGDGNCQFRALSIGLHGSEAHHAEVRALVVAQLKGSSEKYQHFVHEPYVAYVERMARNGEWGDHVTLQAASDALNRTIRVFTDVPEADLIHIRPLNSNDDELLRRPLWSIQRPVCMTFQTEVHYDAAHAARSAL